MKKFLLLACAALVSITASAQKLAAVDNSQSLVVNKFQFKKSEKLVAPEILKAKDSKTVVAELAAKATVKTAKSASKAPKKALELKDIYGDYIEDCFNEFHVCNAATFQPYQYVDQETGTTYDLIEMAFGEGYVDILGEYDPEESMLYMPAGQLCGNIDDKYELAFFGVTEEGRVFSEGALTFMVDDESGAMYCNEGGYVVFVYDIATGESLGYAILGVSPCFFRPNGVQVGYEIGPRTENAWKQTSYPVAIEDYEVSVNVYGFSGFGMVTMDINEDLSVTINTGQVLYDLGLSEEDYAVYGNASLYNSLLVGDNLYMDPECPVIQATLVGNAIVIDDPNSEGYYWVASKQDETGALYRLGIFTQQAIILNEGNFAAGIQDVTMTREEQIKNTKTYNLMGQQVNRDMSKGIMIRNGKKYIKK